MKLINKEEEKRFKPFEVTILVESEEDLTNLWHRMNVSTRNINYNYLNAYNHAIFYINDGTTEFWRFLNEKVKELGIKMYK